MDTPLKWVFMLKIKLKYHYAMAIKKLLPVCTIIRNGWYRGDCILDGKNSNVLIIRPSYKATEHTKPCMPIEKAIPKIRRAFGINLKLSEVVTLAVTLSLESKS